VKRIAELLTAAAIGAALATTLSAIAQDTKPPRRSTASSYDLAPLELDAINRKLDRIEASVVALNRPYEDAQVVARLEAIEHRLERAELCRRY
jgi:hypothetical protein